MIRKKTRKLLLYEAPEVNLVKVDVSCSIMQGSLKVPSSTDIPDITEQELGWS